MTSRVLRCVSREAVLAEAEELGVAPGSIVCDLARVRLFGGLPIAVTTAVVPDYLAPGLSSRDFSASSLYNVLRTEYGVLPTRGRFAIQALTPDAMTASQLEMHAGDPVLLFSQTGCDQHSRAFELASTIYRADRYRLPRHPGSRRNPVGPLTAPPCPRCGGRGDRRTVTYARYDT